MCLDDDAFRRHAGAQANRFDAVAVGWVGGGDEHLAGADGQGQDATVLQERAVQHPAWRLGPIEGREVKERQAEARSERQGCIAHGGSVWCRLHRILASAAKATTLAQPHEEGR